MYEADGDGGIIRRNRDGTVKKGILLPVNEDYEILPVDYTLTFDEAMDRALDGATVQCERDGVARWHATDEGLVRSVTGRHKVEKVYPLFESCLWRVIDEPIPFEHEPERSGDFWLDRFADMIDGAHHSWHPGIVMGKAMASEGVVALVRNSTGSIIFYGTDGGAFHLAETRGGASFLSTKHREIRAVEFSDDEARPTMLFDTDIEHSEFRLTDDDGTVCYGIVFKEIPGEMWAEDHLEFELCCEEECE